MSCVFFLGIRVLASETKTIMVDYLKNHPEYITTCAEWSYAGWGKYTPQKTLKDYVTSREKYLNDNSLPLTLLAFDGAKPIGMCSLVKNRGILLTLSPWLAGLYVLPEYRNQGIDEALERATCQKAKGMGYSKIYCFTSDIDLVPWYVKHGWKIHGTDRLHNQDVTILEKSIS